MITEEGNLCELGHSRTSDGKAEGKCNVPLKDTDYKKVNEYHWWKGYLKLTIAQETWNAVSLLVHSWRKLDRAYPRFDKTLKIWCDIEQVGSWGKLP